MYNIADLNAMSPEQLKDIASSMGLKKVDINDKNSLVFGILDKQAEDMVASAAEKKRNSAKDQPSAKKSSRAKINLPLTQINPPIRIPKRKLPQRFLPKPPRLPLPKSADANQRLS